MEIRNPIGDSQETGIRRTGKLLPLGHQNDLILAVLGSFYGCIQREALVYASNLTRLCYYFVITLRSRALGEHFAPPSSLYLKL